MKPTSPPDGSLGLVALGSNLGDSPALIQVAMARLEALAGGPIRRSSLWISTPIDCPPGSPLFTNATIAFPLPPEVSPEDWLRATQTLERELGRVQKTVHNEARSIDLDLIAWGDEVRFSPTLTLPHPRAHQRRFVLQPLAELVPDLVLPGQCRSVAELLALCPPDPQFRRWGGNP